MRVAVHRRQPGQDTGPHRFQGVCGGREYGSESGQGVQVVPLPPPEPVRLGQAERSAPRGHADHRGQAPHLRPVVVEDRQQVRVVGRGRQAGLLGEFPHRCHRKGLAGLDASARQLPHAGRRPAEQYATGAVGDHRAHPDHRLRLRPALLRHAVGTGRAAQHEDRQALRVEPRHLRPPLGQQAQLLLVQRDVPPLLRSARHHRRDHHQRTARPQPHTEAVQNPGPVVQERDHQAQRDQVVAVLVQRCRIIVLDVQAQPPHPLGARPFRSGAGQGALGEVDRIDGVAEFGEGDGEFAGSTAQIQSPPAVRRGRVPGDQIPFGAAQRPESATVVVVLGPCGAVVCHGSLLVSGVYGGSPAGDGTAGRQGRAAGAVAKSDPWNTPGRRPCFRHRRCQSRDSRMSGPSEIVATTTVTKGTPNEPHCSRPTGPPHGA